MPGWPKDAEAKKMLRILCAEFGWTYPGPVGKSAHGTGMLTCPGGCREVVYGTAKGTARALWGKARRCPHGHAPDRQHW